MIPILILVLIVLVVAILSLSSVISKNTESTERIARETHIAKYGDPKSIGDIPAEIVMMAQRGETIPAIKAYREKTGCDLRTAKERIEAIPRPTALE